MGILQKQRNNLFLNQKNKYILLKIVKIIPKNNWTIFTNFLLEKKKVSLHRTVHQHVVDEWHRLF